MKIFEAIEKRHSTRNYEPEKLSENVKREIKTICDGVKPFQEVKCTWDVKEDEKAMGKIFSEIDSTKWEALVNYGFEGEQIILRLTQTGATLNIDSTLWKALGNREKTPAILRFGKAKESGTIAKFLKKTTGMGSRKTLDKFVDGDLNDLSETAKKCFEMARLSPSAMNRQPWSFSEKISSSNKSELTIKITKDSDLNAIDFGICLSHVYLTLKKLDKEFDYKLTDKMTCVFTI